MGAYTFGILHSPNDLFRNSRARFFVSEHATEPHSNHFAILVVSVLSELRERSSTNSGESAYDCSIDKPINLSLFCRRSLIWALCAHECQPCQCPSYLFHWGYVRVSTFFCIILFLFGMIWVLSHRKHNDRENIFAGDACWLLTLLISFTRKSLYGCKIDASIVSFMDLFV